MHELSELDLNAYAFSVPLMSLGHNLDRWKNAESGVHCWLLSIANCPKQKLQKMGMSKKVNEKMSANTNEPLYLFLGVFSACSNFNIPCNGNTVVVLCITF